MYRAKPLRLQSSLLDGEESYCLYCLDERFVSVLLAMSERLYWLKTWESQDGTQSHLTKAQKSVIQRGVNALVECTDISDMQSNIELILEKLKELGEMNINLSCGGGCGCGCSGGGQYPGDTSTDFPPGGDPPLPGSEPGELTAVELCNRAWDVTSRFIQFFQKAKVRNNGSPLSAGAVSSLLYELLIYLGYGSGVAALTLALANYWASGVVDSAIQMFVEIRPQLINAIRGTQSPQAAYEACKQIVSSSGYGVFTRAVGWALLFVADWDKVYSAEGWSHPSYDECDGTPEPEVCWLPPGYHLESPTIESEVASTYTTSETFETGVSDPCGEVSIVDTSGQFTATNQNWEPIWKIRADSSPDAVGVALWADVSQGYGGNSPSEPVVGVGISDDETLPLDGRFDESSGYKFIACYADDYSALSPVADEILALPGGFNLGTEYYFFGAYRRCGASGTPGGINRLKLRVGFIVPD